MNFVAAGWRYALEQRIEFTAGFAGHKDTLNGF
jgi:hypothetical protein